DGQVRVANQLEAVRGFIDETSGSADGDPTKFELRKTGRLRQPAQTEQQAVSALKRRRVEERRLSERIIAAHFVQNERDAALRATIYELIRVTRGQCRPGRIVRRYGKHRARVGRPCTVEVSTLDLPCTVIRKRVAAIGNRIEACQVIK